MNINISLTDSASAYIQKMLEKNSNQVGFRLSIKKTGCSGYSYFPSMVEKVNPADVMLEINNLKIFIDTAWLDLLQNLHIDYTEEEKAGLKQKRLVFTNPNESSRCGCGESFHVE